MSRPGRRSLSGGRIFRLPLSGGRATSRSRGPGERREREKGGEKEGKKREEPHRVRWGPMAPASTASLHDKPCAMGR